MLKRLLILAFSSQFLAMPAVGQANAPTDTASAPPIATANCNDNEPDRQRQLVQSHFSGPEGSNIFDLRMKAISGLCFKARLDYAYSVYLRSSFAAPSPLFDRLQHEEWAAVVPDAQRQAQSNIDSTVVALHNLGDRWVDSELPHINAAAECDRVDAEAQAKSQIGPCFLGAVIAPPVFEWWPFPNQVSPLSCNANPGDATKKCTISQTVPVSEAQKSLQLVICQFHWRFADSGDPLAQGGRCDVRIRSDRTAFDVTCSQDAPDLVPGYASGKHVKFWPIEWYLVRLPVADCDPTGIPLRPNA